MANIAAQIAHRADWNNTQAVSITVAAPAHTALAQQALLPAPEPTWVQAPRHRRELGPIQSFTPPTGLETFGNN